MGKQTSIAWTHHTFNPAWGCAKVSPGCAHCYADAFSARYGHDVWGYSNGSRKPLRQFGDKHWDEPLRWDREAREAGARRRVFCASMADVFEDHPDWPPLRERLWRLIEATPHLDWLLLTKRPENILRMVDPAWLAGFPRNVWVGTSVENQEYAEYRIPELLRVPARVRFLSCEPLLGPLDIAKYLPDYPGCEACRAGDCPESDRLVRWVIVGGESGPKARLMKAAWVDSLRRQCGRAGVPFFFKQTGSALARQMDLRHPKGEDPAEWPEAWRVQEFPLEVAR